MLEFKNWRYVENQLDFLNRHACSQFLVFTFNRSVSHLHDHNPLSSHTFPICYHALGHQSYFLRFIFVRDKYILKMRCSGYNNFGFTTGP